MAALENWQNDQITNDTDREVDLACGMKLQPGQSAKRDPDGTVHIGPTPEKPVVPVPDPRDHGTPQEVARGLAPGPAAPDAADTHPQTRAEARAEAKADRDAERADSAADRRSRN